MDIKSGVRALVCHDRGGSSPSWGRNVSIDDSFIGDGELDEPVPLKPLRSGSSPGPATVGQALVA
jgi:hypothetical protein